MGTGAELDPGLRRDDGKKGRDGTKMSGRPQNGSTETVRAYAATTGTFTRRAVREALGLSAQTVDKAIDTLVRGKRLRRVAKATFEWIPEKRKGKEAPLEERIWHAMRINPTWSAADIAQQAGTTINYVYNRLRLYRAEGLIKRHGVKPAPLGGSIRIWRLTAEAARKIELPRIEEYSPDPVVVAAVRLNKLVCQGLVRFVDERREAIRLCGEIIAGLGESHEGDPV
jgi:hypothetical protein